MIESLEVRVNRSMGMQVGFGVYTRLEKGKEQYEMI